MRWPKNSLRTSGDRSRPLRGERLEARNLLASFLVTSTDDLVDANPGDGLCQVTAGGPCTLRAAIQEANRLAGDGRPDHITIPPGTYAIAIDGVFEQQALAGDFDLTDDVILQGFGADQTIIDGGGIDRVFDVVAGVVRIDGMTIRGGTILDAEDLLESNGGGIRNEGDLTIVNSTITGNLSTVGSGVANYNGTLRIMQSVITGNGGGATQRGGGVDNFASYYSARLSITDSTLTGNRADAGGGISNLGEDGLATATIASSTLSGNTAQMGGGIANSATAPYADDSQANLDIRNSTLSGNVATGFGGGIRSESDTIGRDVVDVVASTIVGNSAAGGNGGGLLHVPNAGGSVTLVSTILSGNRAAGSASDLAATSAAASFTLIREPSGHSIVSGPASNLVGLDPLLGPLADNGGITQTHALLEGSPAIDQGSNADAFSGDQRGTAFTRVFDFAGIENADDGTDIGAIESGQVPEPFDFGDAPEGIVVSGIQRRYPTRLASDGPRHRTSGAGPRLGLVAADAEPDGQPSLSANGDDLSGVGDEDAIGFNPPSLFPGQPIVGAIRHHGGAFGGILNAWIDFNIDGDWDDPGEQVLIDRSVPAGPAATSLTSITVPSDAAMGQTFLRLRISSQSGLTVRGEAIDGEIEDHRMTIGQVAPLRSDLSLNHSVSDSNPERNESVTLTFVLRNGGPDQATDIVVDGELPGTLLLDNASVSQGVYDDFNGSWEVGALGAGESATLSLTATVDSTDPIEFSVEVRESRQNDPDSTPGNDLVGEDDMTTVTLGTCLRSEPLHLGLNRLRYSCAVPSTFAAFVRGSQRGTTEFDAYVASADIADAEEFAIGIADASGVAEAFLRITEKDLGTTVRVQAFDIAAGSRKSNTLSLNVPLMTNPLGALDVNDDTRVTALDALLVINELNRLPKHDAESEQVVRGTTASTAMFFDTNADFRITAMDALLIINQLHQDPITIEAEKTQGMDVADRPLTTAQRADPSRELLDDFWRRYPQPLELLGCANEKV